MLIAKKVPFLRGCLLLATFIALFILIMSPLFKSQNGERLTGLEYADSVFNALSKGSSYFIPDVKEGIKSVASIPLDVEIQLPDKNFIPLALLILSHAGLNADVVDGRIHIQGQLGKLLGAAVEDSQLLYFNEGLSVSEKYEDNTPLHVAKTWWDILSPLIKRFQKENKLPEARAVELVVRKAVEPGNNFFGITPIKVAEHIPLIISLLVFYVLYAIWYGFGIYEIFEGIGLVAAHKE